MEEVIRLLNDSTFIRCNVGPDITAGVVMLNKFFMILLLCLWDSVFAYPTYCFKNNTDLDAEIGFTSGTRIQQICGDQYVHRGGGHNLVAIAPGEAILIVSIRNLSGYQNTPKGYKIEEKTAEAVEKHWGGFEDKSNLAPFREMYGENIKRAFLVTEDTPGASADSSWE